MDGETIDADVPRAPGDDNCCGSVAATAAPEDLEEAATAPSEEVHAGPAVKRSFTYSPAQKTQRPRVSSTHCPRSGASLPGFESGDPDPGSVLRPTDLPSDICTSA